MHVFPHFLTDPSPLFHPPSPRPPPLDPHHPLPPSHCHFSIVILLLSALIFIFVMIWYLIPSLPYTFPFLSPLHPSHSFFGIFVLSMLFLISIWYLFLSPPPPPPPPHHPPPSIFPFSILLLVLSALVLYVLPPLPSSAPLSSPTHDNQTVCDFIVTNFSTYMKQYLSPPFYTHTKGYKMYLSVFANGRNTGKSTHVSVYATLMRGEYDDQLKWPFEGDIIIELRNWKEDKGHQEDTFSFPTMDGYYRVNGSAWMNVNWDVISSSPTSPCYITPTPTHSTFRMTVCA